ncbi:hypothetical protein [Streptomyces albogriseolus]|uniref:hypothetical protein n=1 Tax=Streptomyces albogriseolus TaxID=1887 RepID=UPI00345FF941
MTTARKTTVERRHAWKAGGLAWVYAEPGRYVCRVRTQRWQMERRVRNPFAGIEKTGWRLVPPGSYDKGVFLAPSMRPAVDEASRLVNEHYEQRRAKGRRVA